MAFALETHQGASRRPHLPGATGQKHFTSTRWSLTANICRIRTCRSLVGSCCHQGLDLVLSPREFPVATSSVTCKGSRAGI